MTDNNTTHAAQSDKCNGWTNYETWRVNLEIWDDYEIEHGDFDDVDALADYLQESSVESIESQSDGHDDAAVQRS